jgi:tRNA(Arg) A34 adenosine deaminase TadA
MGGIIWSRIPKVFFGATIEDRKRYRDLNGNSRRVPRRRIQRPKLRAFCGLQVRIGHGICTGANMTYRLEIVAAAFAAAMHA